MILQALVDYYEMMEQAEDSDIAKPGFSKTKVSFALDISEEGELIGVTSLKIPSGKKVVPKMMSVPEQVKRSSGIAPNFLCDNSSYVLGFDEKGKPEKSRECFESFKELHNRILCETNNAAAKAVLDFLEQWDTDTAREHPAFEDYLDDILKGAIFVFRLNGESFIHEDVGIKEAWLQYKNSNSGGEVRQCLVTGKRAPIARLHPTIKGLYMGQAMGNSLVSFNAPAYESYGKEQGFNSPTSEYAAFAYGTALNALLADDKHKLTLGDTTVVFWADSPDIGYSVVLGNLFMGRQSGEQSEDEQRKEDNAAIREVKSIFEKIAAGKPIDYSHHAVFEPKTRIYILGLSPNAARISVRFFLRDSFGEFIERIARHYRDLAMIKQFDKDFDAIPIWKIVSETVSANSKDKKPSPLLAGAVFRAIMTGSNYPENLYRLILIRIRAEQEVSYAKAAIIKACLIRKSNNKVSQLKDIEDKRVKEVLKVGLQKESENKAYVLGRLFAVLEKVQRDANQGINTTIKDKFFTAASANPGKAFPALLSLSSHHIKKSEYAIWADNTITEIMEKLNVDDDPFPKQLTLEEQGTFYLGYYHQRQDIYTKKDKKEKEEVKHE